MNEQQGNPLTPTTVIPRTIVLAQWDGCDTTTDCPACATTIDGEDASRIIVLKRGRTELFEVGLDGVLAPICTGCAEDSAPSLVNTYWAVREREMAVEAGGSSLGKYAEIAKLLYAAAGTIKQVRGFTGTFKPLDSALEGQQRYFERLGERFNDAEPQSLPF